MASKLAQTPCSTIENTGTWLARLTFPKEEKKRPSLAIAYGTRAEERMLPFSAPSVEITKTRETNVAPYCARKVWAALAATGIASGCVVEFDASTLENGKA